MKPPTDKELLFIAQTFLNSNLQTLGTRKSDRLDFHEVSVWGIDAALRAAYDLGWRNAKKEDETALKSAGLK